MSQETVIVIVTIVRTASVKSFTSPLCSVMMSTSAVSCTFFFSCQELPSLTIDDSQYGIREPVIQFESVSSQPSHRQQKTDMMQRTSVASLTPSPSPKLRIAVSQPFTGNVQGDGIRRSPIGELGALIVHVFFIFWFFI